MCARSNLKKDIGNKVRFQHAEIDCFSTEKPDAEFAGRRVFRPTVLLVNLFSSQYNGNRKVVVDHMWIHIYPNMLSLDLHIGDCISFTARPLNYEKPTPNGHVVMEIGIDTIFNVQFLSRPNLDNYEYSFNNYLEQMIWDKSMMVSDLYLQYYYKHIINNKNQNNLVVDSCDL
jgi:hypothetical protein|nr:MAG TPA: hypothetical protein [Caudoviricetes sp.]